MRLERLTDAGRSALERAFQRAAERRQAAVEPEHLLQALLEEESGTAANYLRALHVPIDRAEEALERRLAALPVADHVAPNDQYIGRPLQQVLDAAEAAARSRKDRYVAVDHLLLGLLTATTPVRELLRELGATAAGLEAQLEQARKGGSRVESRQQESLGQALEKYTRDLTALAREHRLDPVIGRDEEIRRVIQILSRRT